MADSDLEYGSDGGLEVNGTGTAQSSGRATSSRPRERAQAKWEAAASRHWNLQEGVDGGIEDVLGGLEEADKRKRYGSREFYHTSRTDFCQGC